MIGLGFMAIEIPMIQKFILLLGQPTYSFSAVLFTILLTSGFGSLFSRRIHQKWLLVLGVMACVAPLWLDIVIGQAMGWHLVLRLLTVMACLGPAGFIMGIAFPGGIHRVEEREGYLVPWFWAVNGATSVVASVLCAMLSVSLGFNLILLGGGVCYLGAYMLLKRI